MQIHAKARLLEFFDEPAVTFCLFAHTPHVRVLLGVSLAWLAVLGAAGETRACGLSPPIGPNGLPAVCHGDDSAPRFRLGAAAGGTSTLIDFADGQASFRQAATSATLDVLLFNRLSLSATAGVSLIGQVDHHDQRYDLLPGPLGGVAASYRLFGGSAPFLQVSGGYSLARSTTRAPDGTEATFTSRDYRLGLSVGKVFGPIAPFVAARYFGAGTDWAGVAGHGSDHYRYQVGIGAALGLSEHVDALAEIAFLGEKRLSLGAGYLF